jgi:hypothetical protein
MAKQTGNVVTHGLSGKVGDLLLFRQVGGKTVVSKMPQPSKTESEKQKAQRKRFQRAIFYAKQTLADPDTKEIYEAGTKKGRRPFRVAVADFLNAPNIEHIDLSGYSGQTGDLIRIEVSDDFTVQTVTVSISNADGSLVEEGNAVPDTTGFQWTYIATQNNDNLQGDKIVVSISDLPGNITREEETL